jgi:BolA family transcriptional regulator, general stress-responsive regulator
MSELTLLLQQQLSAALSPELIEVRDDSAAHAGHAGARAGAHLAVRIVSDKFAGLRPLQRHRLVYAAAAPLLPDRIHALQVDACTPAELKESLS